MAMDSSAIWHELSARLTALIFNETATAVTTKIKAIQNNKDIAAVRNNYEEIVNQLLSEREEALRIAQTYRIELDRYQISDGDIKHLHATVEKIVEIFKQGSDNQNFTALEQCKDLISVDTLKAMQLLGFNYKRAIGEPLTELCANKIGQIASTATKRGK